MDNDGFAVVVQNMPKTAGIHHRGPEEGLMRAKRKHSIAEKAGGPHSRSGVSTLDYVLVLCVILPLATIVIPNGMRMISLVYDMIAVTVSWPFM